MKILATFLVVVLHTVDYGVAQNNKNTGLLFFYLGTTAIPLFFMVNGYLQLRKVVDYKYIFKKILKILFVVFIWNLFYWMIQLIIKGRTENIIYEIIINFLQKGHFGQFWFLGSLIIMYLILPLISKIFNNKSKRYCIILTATLTTTCILIDLFNIRNNFFNHTTIQQTIIQTFRLWTWFTYFCLGGLINKLNLLEKLKKRWHFIIMILTSIIFLIYQYCVGLQFYGNLYVSNFYDSGLCIFTTIIVFTYLKKINFKNNGLIQTLGQTIMGIYIIHPFIINSIKNLIPISNNFVNILLTFIVFGICGVISYIIYRIPKLNNIIKL